MSDTVSATPGTERLASAAHCAAAEDEFARARALYHSEPDEYRRRREWASMHRRFAEVITHASSLVTEYALAEINPAWTSLRMFAGSQAKAWNEFIGTRGGGRRGAHRHQLRRLRCGAVSGDRAAAADMPVQARLRPGRVDRLVAGPGRLRAARVDARPRPSRPQPPLYRGDLGRRTVRLGESHLTRARKTSAPSRD